jgi:hypothetical protein
LGSSSPSKQAYSAFVRMDRCCWPPSLVDCFA